MINFFHAITEIKEQLTSDVLFAFDFDGTLSPLTDQPKKAILPGSTAALLRELAEVAPVLVISGRSVADLKKRIPVDQISLVGNHGIESSLSQPDTNQIARETCRKWMDIIQAARLEEKIKGVYVEDKGCSLSIHYRHAVHPVNTHDELLKFLSPLNPAPRIMEGKYVINVLPQVAAHKGVALLEHFRHRNGKLAFYVGDDVTDEDVFSLKERNLITIRVGYNGASQARFFIESQTDIDRLIQTFLTLAAPLKR